MHPKKWRERIQKIDKFMVSRNNNFNQPQTGRYTPSDILNNFNSNTITQLRKSIFQIASSLQSSAKSSEVLGGYSQQMQARDHYAIIVPPKLIQKQNQRQKQIKLWLAQICHRVFSVSFNYFSSKVFDTKTTKAFCSQCLISNVISLSKNNELKKQDFQLINNHLKKQLLPYYLLRYPQQNNKQVNQKLNKSVSSTDYLDTNQNNIFLKSKIIFQNRQNGIYFDFIMRFLNYIQQLPQKQVPSQNGLTAFDCFNEQMQKLFTLVYKRRWVESQIYDNFLQQEQSVQTLRQNYLKLQDQIQKGIIKHILQNQNLSKENKMFSNFQKDYQQSVKQYTKYAINRKVSENVRLYSSQQIFHGNIKILDPSILRIIIKWCSQLEQKFEWDYFVEKNEPFVMVNGDEVEMTDQFRQKLNLYLNQEWKQIQKFLSNISNNIHEKQAELSFKNLMYYSTNKLAQNEQILIKFANRNTQDVNHYAICYLNRLIHGLLKIGKKIYDEHLTDWAEWPYPPNLISFTVSDLMRCKCSSKQKQIIRIYKQLQIQSLIRPNILKIIKVKNRLTKGTKDILLNVLFYQQVLCQIQLSIKVDKSEFSLWSDRFNHYIYELQRSTFGPITELCSIWCNQDQRSSLLKNQKIRVQQINHICQNVEKVPQIFPFTCNMCFRHYCQSRYIYDHHKCLCNKFWICAQCRLKTLSQKQLINLLNKKIANPNIGVRVLQEQQFPQYFIGYKLQSIRHVGQNFRKFIIDKEVMVVSLQHGKIKVIPIKKHKFKASNKQLFQYFIFFTQKTQDAKLANIQIQQVLDQIVLEQIKQCYKRKSQSLRITRKNITTQLLTKIKNPRAQYNIDTLIFPQNSITSLKQIAEAFPNARMLNLNKNKIQSLQGISKMKKLTDLYLGQNKFKQIVELDSLTNLKYVQLGDNIYSPQFKCNLSKLNQLESLTLIRSNLHRFPEQVCNLENLKLLWLFQNRITEIPTSIQKLKQLQYLHLEMNQLTQLPQQIYTLVNLKKLMLSFNKINKISTKICVFSLLQILSLEDNPLSQIPYQSIKKLRLLQMITLNKSYQAEFIRNKITPAVFK